MPIVVVSPHFDDAVLSCWSLAVAGREATNLGGLEGQYGDGSVDEDVLAASIRDAEVVYLPAGTTTRDDHVNREHVRVREAAL